MAGFGGDKTWIAVQQNTFTNWCNSSLKGTGNKIEDLVTDLDDGVKLVVLLEQLSKKKVSSKYVLSCVSNVRSFNVCGGYDRLSCVAFPDLW